MVGRFISTMCIIKFISYILWPSQNIWTLQLCLPCSKAAISALMFKFFILPDSTYNYNYSCTHKNIEEKSISVLQQSLSVEVRRSKATMIGHKGHKEAKTRLCTLNCRLYRYLLDCKVGLLTCVHCKSVMYWALGKLGVHQAWKFWCTIELGDFLFDWFTPATVVIHQTKNWQIPPLGTAAQ